MWTKPLALPESGRLLSSILGTMIVSPSLLGVINTYTRLGEQMTTKETAFLKFWSELRGIGRHSWLIWNMIPRTNRAALGGAVIIMCITSGTATTIPLLIGRLVDAVKQGLEHTVTREHMYVLAAWFLGGVAFMVLLRELLNVLRRYLVENTCTRIDKHLSVRVVAHLLKVDLARFTHTKVGALHGRIFRSVEGSMRLVRLSFLDFLPAITTGLFALGAAIMIQPRVGLLMIGVIPVSVFLTAWQLHSQKGVRLSLNRSREDLDGTVVEQLGALDYVRVCHTHLQEVKRIAHAAENRRRKELRHHISMSFFGCAKALTEGFFHLMVLGMAVYLAIQGTISYGDIFTFSMLFLSVMTPLAEVHRVLDEGHEASLRVADLIEMLHLPIDRSFHTVTHQIPRLDDSVPIIEVENLRVEYPSATGQTLTVLDGTELTIHAGETIGIVGRTGCGKSTLLKVLMRLVHPIGGNVRLKGVPLEEVSREAISRLVGYVGQSPFMFSGTIEENITYGCQSAYLPEDIRRAAQKACVHEDIMGQPLGYKTRVAERGQNLSGGQRQRLALARVFLQNPPILILDEATSALDMISERSVQDAIDLARTDRTVIIVAHRLSTLIDADRIMVFDQGRIAECGSYAELVKMGGIFTEMLLSAEKGSPTEEPDDPAEPVARSA
jgi:ATP-binding cassette, subfamily B, bacterial